MTLIRPYTDRDCERYFQFQKQAESFGPVDRYASREALGISLARPGFSPGEDLLIMEGPGAGILASIVITREPFLKRAVISLLVGHPGAEYDAAAVLLEEGLDTAANRGMQVAHTNVFEDEVEGRGLLERMGFSIARRYLELETRLTDAGGSKTAGPAFRQLRAGEEGKLARLQNAAFEGSWGYNPNTEADTGYMVDASGGSENITIMEANGEFAAYCWIMPGAEGEFAEPDAGRIFMIGVHPSWQGRGLGRYALLGGLTQLKDRGKVRAVLTVDSQNRVALALYESMCFRVTAATLWYEKKLTPRAGGP